MKVKNKIFVMFIIINITGFIFGGCLAAKYSSEFQKYEEYYSSIITGIGFILGLIVVCHYILFRKISRLLQEHVRNIK